MRQGKQPCLTGFKPKRCQSHVDPLFPLGSAGPPKSCPLTHKQLGASSSLHSKHIQQPLGPNPLRSTNPSKYPQTPKIPKTEKYPQIPKIPKTLKNQKNQNQSKYPQSNSIKIPPDPQNAKDSQDDHQAKDGFQP